MHCISSKLKEIMLIIGIRAGQVGPVIFRGDNDIHYSFCSETAPETISKGLKLIIFLEGECPQTPLAARFVHYRLDLCSTLWHTSPAPDEY